MIPKGERERPPKAWGLLLPVLLLIHFPETRRGHAAHRRTWLRESAGCSVSPRKKRKGNYGATRRKATVCKLRAPVHPASV